MSHRLAFPSVISTTAAILILAAGCADQSPTATRLDPTARVSAAQMVGQKVNAVRAEHRFQAGAVQQVIGPEGGTIQFGIGEIEFPAGAVAHPTLIAASVDGETMAVDFAPHGLQFSAGAEPRLTFYTGGIGDGELVITYVGADADILEVIPTSRGSGIAWGLLTHYSKYVLSIP